MLIADFKTKNCIGVYWPPGMGVILFSGAGIRFCRPASEFFSFMVEILFMLLENDEFSKMVITFECEHFEQNGGHF